MFDASVRAFVALSRHCSTRAMIVPIFSMLLPFSAQAKDTVPASQIERGLPVEAPPTPLPQPAPEREPGLMRMLRKSMACPAGTSAMVEGRSLAESLQIETLGEDDKRTVLGADYNILSEARPMTPLRPQYPQPALASGLSGRAWVAALIAADGRVMRAQTLCASDPLFDVPAAQAMRAASFEVVSAGGETGPMLVFQTVRFELMDDR
jgi:TonB family protein